MVQTFTSILPALQSSLTSQVCVATILDAPAINEELQLGPSPTPSRDVPYLANKILRTRLWLRLHSIIISTCTHLGYRRCRHQLRPTAASDNARPSVNSS